MRQGLSGVEAIKRGIAHGWGLPVASEALPRLHLSDADRDRLGRWMAANGCTDGLVLGMSVEASSQIERWPAQQFATVADFCIAQYSAIVLLFAAPQESQAPKFLAALQYPEQVRLMQTAEYQTVGFRLAAPTGQELAQGVYVEERASRFWGFALGVAVYAFILMVLKGHAPSSK